MPTDTKPHRARQAKSRRRIRKIGDLTDARRKLWQAITTAEDVLLDDETTAEMELRAVHAITQACSAFAKLTEISELEARLTELERKQEKSMGNRQNGRAYA